MKRWWFLGTALVLAAILAFGSGLGRSQAQAKALTRIPANLEGDWQFQVRSIAGIAEPTTDLLKISADGRGALMGDVAIQFLATKDEITQVLVCGVADEVCMGGGGPRKGICRINADGRLEIVEARSAAQDFPIDFSQSTIIKAVYSLLSPVDSRDK